MRSFLHWLRRCVAEQRLRQRFPAAVIHAGASADQQSRLGRHAVLFRNAALCNSQLGAFSYVQANTTINNADVGPYCAIAADVTVGLAAHPTSLVSMSPVFYDNKQPLPKFFVKTPLFTEAMPRTVISADVWIGQGALVKAGVTIGVGAVVGAGAVVTKDVAPYAIVAGNPCREIRRRFAPDLCERLIDSRWWELDEGALISLSAHFPDPERFCDQVRHLRDGICGRTAG